MKTTRLFTFTKTLPIGFILSGALLYGAETEGDSASPEARRSIVDLDPVRIVGGQEEIELIPGSAAFIDQEEMRRHNYDNIEQAVRRVPGVYFRTEDGFGLFPNISLRGVGSMRTSSVTLMEDRILSAPAPYAAPAAYYTPTTGRMAGIEMIKGSSQVKFGPHTTGGVINYLSTPVPTERTGYVRSLFGENNEFRFHAYAGETIDTGNGRFGFLVENYYRSSDGFKRIDGIGNIQGSNNTGFTNNEPMLKLFWEPDSAVPQRLEFKVGYTDRKADETYLGLTEEDFAQSPNRRYASTMFDNIATDQTRTYLRYLAEPTPDSSFVATAYYNEFNRAWYKLNDVRLPGGPWRNLSETLAGQYGDDPLGVLRGTENGDLRVRNNNREYVSYGIQTTYSHTVPLGNADHTFEIGLRLHEDSERRFQNDDVYEVDANNRIFLREPGAPGSQDDRKGEARAIAIHVKDTIEWDRLTLSPGIRYEHIRYKLIDDRGPARVTGNGTLDVFAPGIGATYDYTERMTFFGGLFRGFSVPSPTAVINDNLREETSIGFESGVRYTNHRGFRSEAAFFYTDFSNLIVPNNVGGTGTGQAENAGDARVYGLELSAAYDPGYANNWVFRNPNHIAFTWTDATIRSDAAAVGGGGAEAESIFAGARKGNRLPYVPEFQISAGTGIEYGRWGAYLEGFFVPSTYADASNTSQQVRPDAGQTRDARFGKNDSYVLFDVSVHYRFADSAKVFAGVQNLLNEEYIASRLPHGPRPGAPRFAHIGMEVTF